MGLTTTGTGALAVISGLEDLQSLTKDIRQLNMMYLASLRELARKDVMQAQLQFGVSAMTATRVGRLGLDDIKELADSSNFIFTIRSSAAFDALLTALTAQDHSKAHFDSLRFSTLLCDQQSPASPRFREAVNQ